VVLFTVLPFSARSQADEGEVTLGTTHSAPANFRFAPIFWRTTLISALVFGTYFVVTVIGGYSLDDLIALSPDFRPAGN
jgi:predicted secreted protein